MVRLIMAHAKLPISFWGDALQIVGYVLNCVPMKPVTLMPHGLWTNRKLDLSILRSQGSVAYIHDSSYKYGKLGLRGIKSIFIRYFETSKGQVFTELQDSESATELESRDITFLENNYSKRTEIGQVLSLYENDDLDHTKSFYQSGIILGDEELVSHKDPSLSLNANEICSIRE